MAAALVGLACLGQSGTRAQSRPDHGSLEPVDLRVAFTRSSFVGVNEADAMAAFKVFTARMGEKRGYRITAQIRIFDDLAELGAEIDKGTQSLVIIDSWQYLDLDPGSRMPIEFAAIEQGVVNEEYLLLARANADLRGLADLAGKHVIVLENSQANTGRLWLETELLELGILDPREFVGRYEISGKPSQVVLPVFFGNADACVVDRSGFEVMAEMNPQVGRKLKVVGRSDPYLDTIACVRVGGWKKPHHRDDLIAALEELPDDPAGQQIMTLFKFDGLIRFEERYLDTSRALHARHAELLSRVAMQPRLARAR